MDPELSPDSQPGLLVLWCCFSLTQKYTPPPKLFLIWLYPIDFLLDGTSILKGTFPCVQYKREHAHSLPSHKWAASDEFSQNSLVKCTARLACSSSQGLSLGLSSRNHVQWLHVGSLKSTMAEVFTVPNQQILQIRWVFFLPPPPPTPETGVYQHITEKASLLSSLQIKGTI